MRGSERYQIGIVSYLNTLPLVHYLHGYRTIRDVPSALSHRFANKQLDCALLPVYEVLKHPEYLIVESGCLASRGEVESVLLFLNKPIEYIQIVALDESSQSSANLLSVLLKKKYQKHTVFETLPPKEIIKHKHKFDAYLLIGDAALEEKIDNLSCLDLGLAWYKWTNLPFVFAVWVMHKKQSGIIQALNQAKQMGMENLEHIINLQYKANPEFLYRYFTQSMLYELGPEEKKGIQLYGQYLYEMQLIPASPETHYVGI